MKYKKKDSSFLIRISKEEKKILKKKADREGRSLASYLLWAAWLVEDKTGTKIKVDHSEKVNKEV
jgi:hypothetical protein